MARLKNLIEESESLDITELTYSTPIKIAGGQVLSVQCVNDVPVAADGEIQLQKSNDGVTWENEGSPEAVTDSGNFFLEKLKPTGAWYRVALDIDSGEYLTDLNWLVKGIDG